MATILDKTKLALRISHTALDDDIADTIETAKEEMIRAGVSASVMAKPSGIVERAIKTYCLWTYAPDMQTAEGYLKSWEYQVDNIRKSQAYARNEGEL